MKENSKDSFLPTSVDEGKEYYHDPNLTEFDVVFVTGDPYYDHPLSGIAILSRLLDTKGYKVGIIAQPLAQNDYKKCGKPKYFFSITSGLLDSMLANYTPLLKKRENILVPERALMVYTQNIKKLFKGSITVLGGVEATIRRFTHFDYKDNVLRRGILNDTKADVLLFGNGERSMLNLLLRMKKLEEEKKEEVVFEKIKEKLDLDSLDGAAFRVKKGKMIEGYVRLPSFEECVEDKTKFGVLARITYLSPEGAFIEECGLGAIQHNRPSHTLTENEMDLIYSLPFTRKLHPKSRNLDFNRRMVDYLEHSVVIGRGCWGSCSFCVIPLVQGKEVAIRSKESIVKEIEILYANGVKKINDLTLPTLNMYGSYCELYDEEQRIYSPIIEKEITVHNKTQRCSQQCAGCPSRRLSNDLYPLLEEIEKLNDKYNASLELRSAIRHDIILKQKILFRKIMRFVTRLKIAPEHISDTVLRQMNKADRQAFEEFLEEYKKVNREQKTDKNLVPYFVVAHPGCGMEEMDELQRFCKEHDLYVNLTQVFTPTPGTLSTAIYYTGENPLTRQEVYVPRAFREKKEQKNVLFDSDEEFNEENG